MQDKFEKKLANFFNTQKEEIHASPILLEKILDKLPVKSNTSKFNLTYHFIPNNWKTAFLLAVVIILVAASFYLSKDGNQTSQPKQIAVQSVDSELSKADSRIKNELAELDYNLSEVDKISQDSRDLRDL